MLAPCRVQTQHSEDWACENEHAPELTVTPPSAARPCERALLRTKTVAALRNLEVDGSGDDDGTRRGFVARKRGSARSLRCCGELQSRKRQFMLALPVCLNRSLYSFRNRRGFSPRLIAATDGSRIIAVCAP